jgi:hypothetical protein
MSLLTPELTAKFQKVKYKPLKEFLKAKLNDPYKSLALFLAYYISSSIKPTIIPNDKWWTTHSPWWDKFLDILSVNLIHIFIPSINEGTCFKEGTTVEKAVQCLLEQIRSLITNSVPTGIPLPSGLEINKDSFTSLITVNLTSLNREHTTHFRMAVNNILYKSVVEEEIMLVTPLGQVAFTALLLILLL